MKGKAMLAHTAGDFKQWIPIHSRGREAGYVKGKTFYVAIFGSKDMLRQPKAICFLRSTLQAAATAGATRIEVYDRESRMTYATTLYAIDTHGFTGSGRHCSQIALPIDRWSVLGVTPDSKLRVTQTTDHCNQQLSLFVEEEL